MDTVIFQFQESEGNLEPKALSEYLSLLEGLVIASHDLGIQSEPGKELPAESAVRIRSIRPLQWNRYFDSSGEGLIQIQRIKKESPLEIVLIVSVTLITLGVIFSGGEIEVGTDGRIKAKIPPLGEGLRSLREALGLSGKVSAGFGIRTTKIKLNKQEYDLLMQIDPRERGKGGFQNFLIGLQGRVNRGTRVLHLSDTDLEKIMRHKANANRGGFQSRFKKIFGRHFPDGL